MALIKCPECGKEVSNTCDVCIHCGFQLKNNISEVELNKDDGVVVVAHRDGPGSIFGLGIFDVVFGLMIVIANIILITKFTEFFYFYAVLLAVGVYCVCAGVIGFIRIHMNATLGTKCILYDKTNNVLILNTLKGKRIEIKPEQYVNMYCHFFTDYIIQITYREKEGKLKKVKLGFCHEGNRAKRLLNDISGK